MKHTPWIIALAVCSGLLGSSVLHAQVKEAKPAKQRVEMITDQVHGNIAVKIDGKQVLLVDNRGLWSNGVRVTGDVSYSGVLTDTGDSKDLH